MTWQDELASLVEDTGIRYAAGVAAADEEERDGGDLGGRVFEKGYYGVYEEGTVAAAEESLKEQLTGFVMATGEMLRELGRGCWDIAQQSLEGVDETYVGKKVKGHWTVASQRLEFLNEYLPEDRDPVHAWSVIVGVFLLALLGFGESDPHPGRNLNSSAMDMLHLANAVGVKDKFWVVGYSGGAMHAWAAVRYIPDRLAGVAMFAPMANPYDSSLNKEEIHKIRDKWTMKRKLMFVLARRIPSILSYFYHRSFLSGEYGQPEKWLSLSLGKKDKSLLEEPTFREFWEKDVSESVRQGNPKPFIEEAVLQVSNWGFSLADLQVQKQRQEKGLLSWLKSLYSQAEHEWAGFPGPIHIWQVCVFFSFSR
ncbi:hypothetical protein B296_00025114 [Ensete ventricosum]|uniref:AB hydrolase-1 domain-containing protein n=1 Tax=Ensete ventricosum TaxID=4639 RepID=A0A426YJ40_ENSVE|nr:hypothetical protein B296_00025114 [Ensete ventricosum]